MYNLKRIIIYPGPFAGKKNMQEELKKITKDGYKIFTITERPMDLLNDSNNHFGDDEVCEDIKSNTDGKKTEGITGKSLVKRIF